MSFAFTVGQRPTQCGQIEPGFVVMNNGQDPVYLADNPGTVNAAPQAGIALYPASAVVWNLDGYLWASCPAGSNPQIVVEDEGQIPFTVPFAQGEQIIPTGLHSYGYVAGVTGWRIAKAGEAEFLSVTVRGNLIVQQGNSRIRVEPSGAITHITINPDITIFSDGEILGIKDSPTLAHMLLSSPYKSGGADYSSAIGLFSSDGGANSKIDVTSNDFNYNGNDVHSAGPWVSIATAGYFNAGFSDFTAAAGSGYACAYRFLSPNDVELRGTMHKGTGAGGVGANGFAGGDIPITFPGALNLRPAGQIQYSGGCQSRAGNMGNYRAQLSAAGNLSFQTDVAHDPGWISIDGWHYSQI